MQVPSYKERYINDDYFRTNVPVDLYNKFVEIETYIEYLKELYLFLIKYKVRYYGMINLEYVDVKIENRLNIIKERITWLLDYEKKLFEEILKSS